MNSGVDVSNRKFGYKNIKDERSRFKKQQDSFLQNDICWLFVISYHLYLIGSYLYLIFLCILKFVKTRVDILHYRSVLIIIIKIIIMKTFLSYVLLLTTVTSLYR